LATAETAGNLNPENSQIVSKLTPYSIVIENTASDPEEMGNGAKMKEKQSNKMVLKCKSCGSYFDSTFSVEEFSSLPPDQNESGTLHLCPQCGNLSIYELKDYKEPQS
jgi:hypothetical protein